MSYDRIKLLLSIQRALLGTVTPNLRMVTGEGDNRETRLIFYYDGETSEEINELAEVAATEIISSFSNTTLDFKILRLDAPQKMKSLSEIAYLRCETEAE